MFILNSCDKENDIDLHHYENNNLKSSKKSNHTLKNNAPQLYLDENGVLVFDDVNEFKYFFEWAEIESQNYVDSFLVNYSDLTGDELADSLFEAGFNSDLPLQIFEESFPGYNSLRKKIETEMQPYLELDDFDFAETPDAYFINDPFFRTILNEDGAYRIGDTTYFILDSGYVALGPSADYNLVVQKIENGDPIASLVGYHVGRVVIVILTGGGGSGGGGSSNCSGQCRTNRYKAKDKRDGNRKYTMDLSFMYSSAGTHLTMKVKSYRRLASFLPWVIYPASKFSAHNTFNIYTGSGCTSAGTIQGQSKTNNSFLRCTVRHTEYGSAARRVRCNELVGTGSTSGVPQSTVTIGW